LSAKRILVYASDKVIGSSLMQLLSVETDFEVIGTSYINKNGLIHTIRKFSPDFLIYPPSTDHEDKMLLGNIIANFPDLKIITINLLNNHIRTYTNKDILLSQSSDLAKIIRSQ
jgi:hypothetical protein